MNRKSIFDVDYWPTTEELEERRAARAYMWRGVRKTIKWTFITAGVIAIVGALTNNDKTEDEKTV